MQSVYFGGSRNLKSSFQVGQVVAATIQAGQSIHVGCCQGADQAVITSALMLNPSFLVVFAIFSEAGLGACSLSAVGTVQVASMRGASMQWLAGGELQVPLNARLINRSIAAASGCEAAVLFQPGTGSLAVAAVIASSIPVYVFASSIPAPLPGHAGQWVNSSFQGQSCFQWLPAQLSLF